MCARWGPALLILTLLALFLTWAISPSGPMAPVPPVGPEDTPLPPPVVPADASSADPSAAGESDPATPSADSAETLTLSGTVYTQDGTTPVSRAVVVWIQGQRGGRLTAGKDGTFRIGGLSPGTVEVTTSARVAGQGDLATIEVPAGSEAIRLVLPSLGMVHVDIVDRATGQTVRSWLRLILLTDEGEIPWALSGEDSRPAVTLHLRPGKPLRFRVDAVGYRSSGPVEVHFEAGKPIRTVRVALEPDPAGVATLVLRPRMPGGEAPDHVQIRRHAGNQVTARTCEVVGGGVEMRAFPGENNVEVWPGRTRPPWWVPVRFRVHLTPGQRWVKEVRFVRGGILVFRGPNPRKYWFPDLLRDGVKHDRVHVVMEDFVGVCWARYGPLEPGWWTIRHDGFREARAQVRAGHNTIIELTKE